MRGGNNMQSPADIAARKVLKRYPESKDAPRPKDIIDKITREIVAERDKESGGI